MFFFSNSKIQNLPYVTHFLHEESKTNNNYCVGWGRKASFVKAQAKAQLTGATALCLEDGFIRSMGLGKQDYPGFSLVVDQVGIYFDASQASTLEQLIQAEESEVVNLRAQHCIARMLQYGVTKYNQKYTAIPQHYFQNTRHILVVDQTFADQSISGAGADAACFKQMLHQACRDHPDAQVWLKIHPDVLSGKAKGHFSVEEIQALTAQYAHLKPLTAAFNPIELLNHMHEVYVVSSHMGFEALLCNKKLHCFAAPWYAGWGLTDDRHARLEILKERRKTTPSLAHVFAAAYFYYARYISPTTAQRCQLESLLDELIPNIQLQKQLDTPSVLYGFSRWKKKFLAQYLGFPNFKLRFHRYIKPAQKNAVVAWGKKAQVLRSQGYSQVTTVEDGFIRSIGLGAHLIRPYSLVFDSVGIYYDATRPSALEHLLNSCQLNTAQIERVEKLKQQIIALNLSKYNVGDHRGIQLEHIQKKKILVVGQVEDDMSIQLGSIDIKTNLALLQAVRKNNPEAYIIYKPHPDVAAGLRQGQVAAVDTQLLVDDVIDKQSIVVLIASIDELHTITSLSGFEALIRGIKVVCYGMPFYAGWGLTQDCHSNARRHKTLSLNELMHCVLIDYAVYQHPNQDKNTLPLTTVEHVVAHLEAVLKSDSNPDSQFFKACLTSLLRIKSKLERRDV